MINKLKAWIMSALNLIAGAALAYAAQKLGQSAEPAQVEQIGEIEMLETSGPMTTGIRNRNAGNVTVLGGGQKWRGQIGEDENNGHTYAVFDTQKNGLRACAKVLRNYQRLHGINTIAGLIDRYAPVEGGNPTNAYADFVARRLLIGVDEPLDLNDNGMLTELVIAVVHFENGYSPFPALSVAAAVAIA